MSAPANKPVFLGLDEEWSSSERSRFIILPAPYEVTTSYGGGTGRAPDAIIEASRYVELYDEELRCEPYRITGGIATAGPIVFGPDRRGADAVGEIRKEVLRHIGSGKTVVTIGGEHTIAVGAALAHAEFYENLSILQLDAHSDLRQEYEGDRYSHASAMARIYEQHPQIVQVGIRSQCEEEALFISEKGIRTFYAHELKSCRLDRQDAIFAALQENVYLTLDCDFFDPSLIPALGTPEPGGFGWDETIAFLRRLAAERNIVGFDVNELAPVPGLSHPQFTIAKLIYRLIGAISSSQPSP